MREDFFLQFRTIFVLTLGLSPFADLLDLFVYKLSNTISIAKNSVLIAIIHRFSEFYMNSIIICLVVLDNELSCNNTIFPLAIFKWRILFKIYTLIRALDYPSLSKNDQEYSVRMSKSKGVFASFHIPMGKWSF